ncbi:MAG: type IV pilus assembly protein PilM [Syntrophobacterales bacterium]|nr:type IV pilus assembly protein PilM [Syntrophobacterales bacterium]
MLKLNGLFSSKKQIAGLDIGSSSVKLAEIAEGPDGYTLQNFASIPLAKGIVADGIIANPNALVERIKELLKISRCRARTVVTSLSGYSVIAKKIGFPSMDEESLRELISDEIEKYLPFGDMKDVNFDFQILGSSDMSPGQMEVFLVAAKKDVVQSYVDTLKKAGLEVAILDVDSFALETMYEENYDYGHDDVCILVNIGASMTNINVVKGGASIFIRDFPLGGTSITENLQDKTGVSFEEAERMKLEKAASGDEQSRDELLAYADPLLLEIERSVDYFRSTYPGKFIKQILLCGGTARMPGIAEALVQRLNVEVEIADPFRKVSADKKSFSAEDLKEIGPQASVGVGLAMRRIGDK